MKRLIVSLLVLLFAAAPLVSAAAAPPELFGFAPAYPPEDLPLFSPPGNLPWMAYAREIPMVLDLDKKGRVTGVSTPDPADTFFVAYVREYLGQIRFEPARVDGKKAASRLPLWVGFGRRSKYPDFVFAIDGRLRVGDRERYERCFSLNDIRLPMLKQYPEYFTSVHWSDTLEAYPLVLLKLALDTAGVPTAIDTVLTTLPEGTMTTASAALWAEYAPAVVRGKTVASECYLLVSYFPQIVYPTTTWIPGRPDSLPVLERARVTLLADTVGLLSKPQPRQTPGNAIYVTAKVSLRADTIGAVLAIDTAGVAALQLASKVSSSLRTVLRRIIDDYSFYPARNYVGEPVRFRGNVLLVIDGSVRIRIKYVW